jgi:hypothetical protein
VRLPKPDIYGGQLPALGLELIDGGRESRGWRWRGETGGEGGITVSRHANYINRGAGTQEMRHSGQSVCAQCSVAHLVDCR